MFIQQYDININGEFFKRCPNDQRLLPGANVLMDHEFLETIKEQVGDYAFYIVLVPPVVESTDE